MTVITWIVGIVIGVQMTYGFAASNKDKRFSITTAIELAFLLLFYFLIGRAVRIW